MRNILRLIAVFVLSFTVTNWAIAGFPPVRIGGLLQALKTKFTLLFPNNSVVMKGGVKAYVDTGNKSHLYDGDFEGDSVATEWSVTNATATLVDTERVNGKQHLNLAVAAAIPSISQDQTVTVGGSFVASCWIKTDQIDVQFCSRIDGADSVCQNVSSSNKWFKYSHQNFTSDASTSFGVSVKGLSSITGNIKVDNCELEFGDQTQNVAQSELFGQVKWQGATNCAWVKSGASFGSYPADSDCAIESIEGKVKEAATKIPAFVIPAGSPAGYYQVRFTGGFISINTERCSHQISDGTQTDFAGSSGISGLSGFNNYHANAIGTLKYDSPITSDITVEIQTYSYSGTCQINSDGIARKLSAEIVYHPPQSQIVRQSQELTAETANSWNASFTSTHTLVSEDFDGVINCVNNGTGDVLCTWPTQTLTEAPTVDCTPFNDPIISDSITCTVREVSTTQARLRLYDANNNSFRNIGYKITVNKSGADYNKSQIVYGQFEQIKSLETPYVYAEGNNGASITANTDINFTEVEDASGLWTNNTTYSPNEDGWYFITGSTGATASHQGTFYIHDGTSTLFFLAPNNLSANVKPFQGIVYLEAAKSYTFRATATFTANNNSQVHRIYIQKWVDTGTLIKNLNDNKNVVCSTKYLSAVVSSTGIMSDLTFSNLTIGKKYKLSFNLSVSHSNSSNNFKDVRVVMDNGATSLYSLRKSITTTFYNDQFFYSRYFDATDTSLTFNTDILAFLNINNFRNGSNATYAEICELPDNYIEGSF